MSPRPSARGCSRRRWPPRSMARSSASTTSCRNPGEVKVRILTMKDPEALGVMRHSAAHIMARAVMRLKKGVQLAFGPTVEGGFYYDFEMPEPLQRRRFSGHRSGDEKDHRPRRALRADRSAARQGAGDRARVSTRNTRSSTSTRAWPTMPRCRSIARGNSSTSAAARTCPVPRRSGRTSCSRSPVPIGKGTPTTPSSSGCMPPRSSRRRSSMST